MKNLKVVLSVLAALVAIAGVVYAFVTYGDKIIAWCKRMISKIPGCDYLFSDDDCFDDDFEDPAEIG